MNSRITFSIASGGTDSDVITVPDGYELTALEIPTIDASTIAFWAGTTTTTKAVKAQDLTAQAVASGTGAASVGVNDSVRLASRLGFIQLKCGSAQTGGARSIIGLLSRYQ